MRIAARTDFADIVDRQRLRRRWFGAILLLAVGGGFILGVSTAPHREPAPAGSTLLAARAQSIPLLARTWFARNVLLRQIDWPQQTYLVVTGAERGELRLPRGATQTVRVTVTESSPVVPELLQVDFAPRRARPVYGLRRASSHDFELTVRNPLEPFRMRVRGGDAQTEWLSVQLIDPPRLVNWELTYERPR
ncbi:MAG: hypothetical protein ACKOU6_11200, partial [Planctomycetota bacterium]